MFVPDNFLVRYVRNGEQKVFITLDKTRAYEYAQQFHGTVVKCFAEDNKCFKQSNDVVAAVVPEAAMSYVSEVKDDGTPCRCGELTKYQCEVTFGCL